MILGIFKHRHKWKFEPMALMYGGTALSRDCDRVPLICKCGAKAHGKWRVNKGLIDIEEEDAQQENM